MTNANGIMKFTQSDQEVLNLLKGDPEKKNTLLDIRVNGIGLKIVGLLAVGLVLLAIGVAGLAGAIHTFKPDLSMNFLGDKLLHFIKEIGDVAHGALFVLLSFVGFAGAIGYGVKIGSLINSPEAEQVLKKSFSSKDEEDLFLQDLRDLKVEFSQGDQAEKKVKEDAKNNRFILSAWESLKKAENGSYITWFQEENKGVYIVKPQNSVDGEFVFIHFQSTAGEEYGNTMLNMRYHRVGEVGMPIEKTIFRNLGFIKFNSIEFAKKYNYTFHPDEIEEYNNLESGHFFIWEINKAALMFVRSAFTNELYCTNCFYLVDVKEKSDKLKASNYLEALEKEIEG
jgi:hypothetical protein